jgi:hypothetical protein
MVKTQIQLPDTLYREAKRIAREREISFAEVVRRGVEYVTRIYPPLDADATAWRPPKPHRLGAFHAPPEDWRALAND